MAARSMKNTLAAMRQLACLGLPAQTVLPEMIRLLDRLVGFDVGVGMHVDEQIRLTDVHVPSYISLADLSAYANRFYDRQSGGSDAVGWTTRQAMQSGLDIVQGSRIVTRRTLEHSDLWNRVLRNYDMGWICQIPLRDGSRPLACIAIARPFTQRDYGEREIQLMRMAYPWMCHAMARRSPSADINELQATQPVASGMLLVDAQGHVLQASDGSLMLLQRASASAPSPIHAMQPLDDQACTLIRKQVNSVLQLTAGRSAAVPAGQIVNAYGRFCWRAYLMHAQSTPESSAQVAIHLEHYLPLSAQLFRSPKFLDLSTRERDVGLALAAGHGTADIAKTLNIKPSSVIDYTRSLYERLGISQARDVVTAVLSE